jgi:DNA-binding transcriptional LysR family regulator
MLYADIAYPAAGGRVGGGAVDLEDLRAFAETVRRGSFSEAARSLNRSQPTVSRSVRRLEARFGLRLLERSRPAVTPTRAGLAVLAFAERMLGAWGELESALRGAGQVRGTLQVAASTTPGEYLLPPLLAAFTREHPHVRVQLTVMNSASAEECVGARHCDVGFVGRPPRLPSLASFVLGEDEIVLAVPAGHPLAARGRVTAADLRGLVWVEREEGSGTRQAVSMLLRRNRLRLPPRRVGLVVSSAQAGWVSCRPSPWGAPIRSG